MGYGFFHSFHSTWIEKMTFQFFSRHNVEYITTILLYFTHFQANLMLPQIPMTTSYSELSQVSLHIAPFESSERTSLRQLKVTRILRVFKNMWLSKPKTYTKFWFFFFGEEWTCIFQKPRPNGGAEECLGVLAQGPAFCIFRRQFGFSSGKKMDGFSSCLVAWNMIFPYIGHNHWLICFRGVEITNRNMIWTMWHVW